MKPSDFYRHKKFIVGFLVVAGFLLMLKSSSVQMLLTRTLDGIAALGPLGLLVFIIVYVLACVFLIPGSTLTLGAGFLFGVLKGSVVVSVASTLGATAAFLVGRYFARDWVGKKTRNKPKFKAIDEAVATEGLKIVGLTRLSPVLPFNVLNYAFGLTKVSLRDYVLASWIGMMPGTVMYVYLGSLAGSLAALGAEGRAKSPAEWLLFAVGLLATVGVTIFVTRIAKQALRKKI
jgi:uncharacterized membrane protein YdjX (TVP38/TMEM64 family)